MKDIENTLTLIFILIVFISITYVLTNKSLEKFIVLIDDKSPNSNCPEYLLTDGKAFYIFDSRQNIEKNKNPKKFETMENAQEYLAKQKCKPMDVINLVVSKTDYDPTENYERICAKKIAPYNYRVETCASYSKDLNEIRKYQSLLDNEATAVDYDLETCMIDQVKKENPSMLSDENIDIKVLKNLWKII
jgi:hypothetical protein